MRQPISKEKYVVAAIITAVIFLFGLFVGLTIEGKRINVMEDMYTEQRIKIASNQLQYGYISSMGEAASCPAIYNVLYNNVKELEDARTKLEDYARDSALNTKSFALLKQEYTIEQVRYWLLAEQAQKICGQDVVRMLYFYGSGVDCIGCDEQAFVLTYLKKLFGDKLLIFALDGSFEQEPIIGVLKKQFNVTAYPGIVMENSTSSNIFMGKDELMAQICTRLHAPPRECE